MMSDNVPAWNKKHTNETEWEKFRNRTQYESFVAKISAGLREVMSKENDPTVLRVLLAELHRQEKFCEVMWWSMWNNELPEQDDTAWVSRGETR